MVVSCGCVWQREHSSSYAVVNVLCKRDDSTKASLLADILTSALTVARFVREASHATTATVLAGT
jgi:hypothetical protein